MVLFDVRLRFARELIGHWLEIRRGELVPLEVDLDPRALLHCFSTIGIVDVTHRSKLIFEMAGAAVRRRFGRDIRHMNWIELVPRRLGDAGQRARERIRRVPCGFYHRFSVAYVDAEIVTAETLMLPLRRRNATLPHAVIGMTREFGEATAATPAAWLTPSADVAHYVMEFVDIH